MKYAIMHRSTYTGYNWERLILTADSEEAAREYIGTYFPATAQEDIICQPFDSLPADSLQYWEDVEEAPEAQEAQEASNDYVMQAHEFLNACPAECSIVFVGPSFPDWDKKHLHNMYRVSLLTNRGRYDFNFWDSISNTEVHSMTVEKYASRHGLALSTARARLKKEKEEATPTAYDILSCLSAYDPGTFSDFCDEFGYSDDSISALKTYTAVCDEYKNLCRIFTRRQLEKLVKIQ